MERERFSLTPEEEPIDQEEPEQRDTEQEHQTALEDLNNVIALLDIRHEGLYRNVSGGMNRLRDGSASRPDITLDNIQSSLELLEPTDEEDEQNKKDALDLVTALRAEMAEE